MGIADSVGAVGVSLITAIAAIVGGLIVAVSSLLIERSRRKSEESWKQSGTRERFEPPHASSSMS